jgi:hypothetical protein
VAKPLIGLRAGLWHDPDGGPPDIGRAGSAAVEGVVHYSAGIGVAFKRLQIDLGFDGSDRTTITAVSAIFTF